MTSEPACAITKPIFQEAPSDKWVLRFSLDEPGRVIPSGVPWAKWGPFHCFFHGFLFDREELARSGHCRLPDCSDADLVLRAYERQGEAILPRLRGSFVVAIVDRARDTAIVARDHLGTHPLFYVEAGSRLLFASTLAQLLDQPGVSRTLNRVVLADYLCRRWPDRHETFFAAVRRVPPGWRIIISGGHLRAARYWDPWPNDQPIQWLTNEEIVSFDEVFNRAVERCLRDGPTGIFLSGGLDSISVAAVAVDRARHIGTNSPLALSLGFPHHECDEQQRQTAVAADLGLRQHLLGFYEAIGSRPLLQQALELNQGLPAPVLNVWQPAYSELVRHARLDGVLNILTGEGGDEWLTVSPYLSADLISRGAFLQLAQFIGALWRSYTLSPAALVRLTLWRAGLRPLAGRVLHRLMPETLKSWRLARVLAGDPSWVAPDRELRAEQRRRAERGLTDLDPPQGFYMRELKPSLDHSVISWAMEELYHFGRKNGVRYLHPFWDPDLVELLYRTPPAVLLKGGRTKGLVRETLSRRFPNLGLHSQRKVRSTSFFESLVRHEGQALIDLAGDFPALSELGIVDSRAMRLSMHEVLHRPGKGTSFWGPINLEIWSRSHHG
jgi:asparagine synthase (glutamine-hydrolysing)